MLILHITEKSWMKTGIYNENGTLKDIFSFIIKKTISLFSRNIDEKIASLASFCLIYISVSNNIWYNMVFL